ncbi:hypothetical protein GCM10018963_14800 [Saccharothrix longispora]
MRSVVFSKKYAFLRLVVLVVVFLCARSVAPDAVDALTGVLLVVWTESRQVHDLWSGACRDGTGEGRGVARTTAACSSATCPAVGRG